jgi:hypothetical protein
LLTDPFLPTHKRHCVTGVAEVKVGGAAEEPAGEAESRWGAESIQYTNDTGVTGVAEVKVGDLHSPPGGWDTAAARVGVRREERSTGSCGFHGFRWNVSRFGLEGEAVVIDMKTPALDHSLSLYGGGKRRLAWGKLPCLK